MCGNLLRWLRFVSRGNCTGSVFLFTEYDGLVFDRPLSLAVPRGFAKSVQAIVSPSAGDNEIVLRGWYDCRTRQGTALELRVGLSNDTRSYERRQVTQVLINA